MASNTTPAGVNKDQAFGMAEMEMEYRVELFNRGALYAWVEQTYSHVNTVSLERLFASIQQYFRYCSPKLAQTCFHKCVDKRYKESELNMGENSCIDRCVSKYWQVNGMIGQMLSAGGRPPM